MFFQLHFVDTSVRIRRQTTDARGIEAVPFKIDFVERRFRDVEMI